MTKCGCAELPLKFILKSDEIFNAQEYKSVESLGGGKECKKFRV